MAVRAASATPLTPLAELEPLVSRAGLNLNAGQMADLALAWRQITELLGRIPRNSALVDDQAYVFRLPPPGTTPAAKAGRKAGVALSPTRTQARTIAAPKVSARKG